MKNWSKVLRSSVPGQSQSHIRHNTTLARVDHHSLLTFPAIQTHHCKCIHQEEQTIFGRENGFVGDAFLWIGHDVVDVLRRRTFTLLASVINPLILSTHRYTHTHIMYLTTHCLRSVHLHELLSALSHWQIVLHFTHDNAALRSSLRDNDSNISTIQHYRRSSNV